MSEETISTTLFTESPASWDTRYITPDGFTCQLTLRAECGKDLLERANSALAYLREHDCIPFYGYNNQYRDNTNNSNKDTSDNDNWCPIHDVELKRWEKNGKVWYSHKTDEGWCYGKERNNHE